MSATTSASNVVSDNDSYKLVTATVVSIVLPTITLGLRLIARKMQHLRLYFDDWLIIFGWVLKVGLDISALLTIKYGMGRHINTISKHHLIKVLKIWFIGSVQYPLCITTIKLSILYQYRRLFPTREFRIMTNFLIIIMTAWCTAVLFTGIFTCTPISKNWYSATPGTCINRIYFFYGVGIPNVVADVLILVLPLGEVRKLDLPLRQKVGVGLTCALWIVSLAFGVVRLVFMIGLDNQGPDVTYKFIKPAIWTTVEPATSIVTACLPSIRVLYRKVRASQHNQTSSQRLNSFSCGSVFTADPTETSTTTKDRRQGDENEAVDIANGYGLQSLKSTDDQSDSTRWKGDSYA